jgi:hypothetical protein
VEYQDGSRESIPIYYGTQVARWDIPYGEHIDAVPYEADPIQADLASTGQPITLFRYEWANPHPEATIHQITLTFMGSLNAALWITACQAILE